MAGSIYEFFGYRVQDESPAALDAAADFYCPFLSDQCEKRLNDGAIAGVCAVKPATSGPVICCPIRLYADNYRILEDVSLLAFGEHFTLCPGSQAVALAKQKQESVIAVFGKRWGGELRLPQKGGSGSYFVDWILARLDHEGRLEEFVAVEVQTIDTTGNYRIGRSQLLAGVRKPIRTTVGLNWENVSKRILPQLVFKGQVLQREELCKKGLFFVCPTPVYSRIVKRLGGEDGLVRYALQPASITFLAYDYDGTISAQAGVPAPIAQEVRRSTTVYKVQEAFNNVTLPEENVYKDSILAALGLH